MTSSLPPLNQCTVAVIGLGYVGLPLAVEFAKHKDCLRTGDLLKRRVIGFDIDGQRLDELREGFDRNNETSKEELKAAHLLKFTNDVGRLTDADVFVVTVPTPVGNDKRPDLAPLQKSSVTVGRALKKRRSPSIPLVIYESTVYPGATEEVCVPILERESGLTFNKEFFCGYSPERINPGDREHGLTSIVKVTSGSTAQAASWVDNFYGSIIQAGTHLTSSLKVAEAAKVIENTQRDLNIALVNELAIIFRLMEIDTLDVLQAAGTKWNFLGFRPGLVGGHCIGVDPYYLIHKAEVLGYHPQVVLAGRRINDLMSDWLLKQLVLRLCQNKHAVAGSRVLVLGLTFKENCPDMRNTKVLDFIHGLVSYGIDVEVVDPWVQVEDVQREYGLKISSTLPSESRFHAVICAVAHKQFVQLSVEQWQQLLVPAGVLLDLKGVLPRELKPLRP